MNEKHVSYKKVVGRQVKLLRTSNGLTQEALAERCGIFRTYLSRIESGTANPTLVVLAALAGALDVHPFELFGQTSPTNTQEIN